MFYGAHTGQARRAEWPRIRRTIDSNSQVITCAFSQAIDYLIQDIRCIAIAVAHDRLHVSNRDPSRHGNPDFAAGH